MLDADKEQKVKVIYDTSDQRVPIKAWLSEVDEGTLEQARNLARLPFVRQHVALMPDAHVGYGMPIGGVIATENVVIPYAVGNDIGCGMHARRTNIEAGRLAESHRGQGTVLKATLGAIQRAVPVGGGPGGNHKHPQAWAELDQWLNETLTTAPADLERSLARAGRQLGTLGSGNHFLELQADEEGYVWIMLHSGSRGLGAQVCTYYDRLAQRLNEEWHSDVPREARLAFLPVETREGQEYLRWMTFCMAYALENRTRMLDAAVEALFQAVRSVAPDDRYLITEAVDTHHNYADFEHHFGSDVLVHRKGAVRARAGEMVIIPGSMETGSYIARGLGNRESFETCSHGAGRRLSRSAAKRERSAQDVIQSMRAKGIMLAKPNTGDVAEEAGHAYKDVDQVMRESADLVEPVFRLRPLGVLKG